MVSYKAPDFSERIALAKQARDKALEKLRDRPAVDPAQAAERQAARLAKEAAARERRQARLAEQKQRQADKRAAAAANATPAAKPKPSEDEARAARDAKYAARKARKK